MPGGMGTAGIDWHIDRFYTRGRIVRPGRTWANICSSLVVRP